MPDALYDIRVEDAPLETAAIDDQQTETLITVTSADNRPELMLDLHAVVEDWAQGFLGPIIFELGPNTEGRPAGYVVESASNQITCRTNVTFDRPEGQSTLEALVRATVEQFRSKDFLQEIMAEG